MTSRPRTNFTRRSQWTLKSTLFGCSTKNRANEKGKKKRKKKPVLSPLLPCANLKEDNAQSHLGTPDGVRQIQHWMVLRRVVWFIPVALLLLALLLLLSDSPPQPTQMEPRSQVNVVVGTRYHRKNANKGDWDGLAGLEKLAKASAGYGDLLLVAIGLFALLLLGLSAWGALIGLPQVYFFPPWR